MANVPDSGTLLGNLVKSNANWGIRGVDFHKKNTEYENIYQMWFMEGGTFQMPYLKVACMFSWAVCAGFHVHPHQHYESTQENNLNILWKFCDDLTLFGKAMRVCSLLQVHAGFQVLCMHACMCMPMDIINQLRRQTLTYTESFVKILLHLAEIWGVWLLS